MGDHFDLAVILFSQDDVRCRKTLDSLKQQTIWNRMQVLVIGARPESFVEENITYLCEDETGNFVPQLQENIRSDYITITQSGVRYVENAMEELLKAFDTSTDMVIAPVDVPGQSGRPVLEHNAYCRRYRKGMNFSTNAYILHNTFIGYLFRRDKVQWSEKLTLSNWGFEVLKTVFRSVLGISTYNCVAKDYMSIPVGREITDHWNDYYRTLDGAGKIFGEFMLDMRQIAETAPEDKKKNAEYVLLYYVSRLMEIVGKHKDYKNHEIAVSSYMRYCDDVLTKMKYDDLIVANQYINKINKRYLLEKFFDREQLAKNEMTDFIFHPEHNRIQVMFFEVRESGLHVEFLLNTAEGQAGEVLCGIGDKRFTPTRVGSMEDTRWGSVKTGAVTIYSLDVDLTGTLGTFRWFYVQNGTELQMKTIAFMRYTPLADEVFLYHRAGRYMIYGTRGKDGVRIRKHNPIRMPSLFVRRSISFVKKGKPGIKAIAARIMFEVNKRKQKKNIWLVSDRTNRGDDNGEVMYRYLCENAAKDIEPYFVVDKGTPDWKELSKLGKVVAPFSKQHKMLFLQSEFLLSSQANKAVVNPFGVLEYFYRDLMYDKRLVFLQHGITKDNQSKWLNKYNRNLFGFVVTTQPEYDSVFQYDYFYDEEHVWLTGMPRYDRLYHDERKYVTVMPTWRKSLSAGTDQNGVWILGREFSESEYFDFYNSLLNNERLLSEAERLGYTVCFMPHPNTISGIHLFKQDPRVRFMDATSSYRDVFAQTDLMVTDYSSVAFDFAYLRKPIIYSQFDKEAFFNGEHSYTEGYFDYERDGFGEVEYTLEATIERVIEYMENHCELKEKYQKRIQQTFAYSDCDCSRRVYERILKYR